jgi:hypothetical protein
MFRHEQPGDDFTLHHMSFHDFRDIGFRADPVPNSLRVDYDAWTEVTMVKTTSLIGADNAFKIESLGFAFEMSMKFFRT